MEAVATTDPEVRIIRKLRTPFFNRPSSFKTLRIIDPALSKVEIGPPPPNAPLVLVGFVVLHPRHDRNVTDFRVWDAHEARLRCPDDVSGDIGGCGARRARKPKFY